MNHGPQAAHTSFREVLPANSMRIGISVSMVSTARNMTSLRGVIRSLWQGLAEIWRCASLKALELTVIGCVLQVHQPRDGPSPYSGDPTMTRRSLPLSALRTVTHKKLQKNRRNTMQNQRISVWKDCQYFWKYKLCMRRKRRGEDEDKKGKEKGRKRNRSNCKGEDGA